MTYFIALMQRLALEYLNVLKEKVIMKYDNGFSLLEMAVVLIIVSLLLSTMLVPFSTYSKNAQYKETVTKLETIKEALMGYYLANQRFPCPATGTSDGRESFDTASDNKTTGACDSSASIAYGFVPYLDLGLYGRTNDDNLLVDAWNNPFLYAVGGDNNCTAEKWVLTKENAISPDIGVQLSCVTGKFTVCKNTSCTGSNIAVDVPIVILSMGEKRHNLADATDAEDKNIDSVQTGASGKVYPFPSNQEFVMLDYNENSFDDLVTWISPYVLYNRMVTAGVYP